MTAECMAWLETGRSELTIGASARLPTRHGEFMVTLFHHASAPEAEHLAIVNGDVAGDDVLVRLHSECLTGEILGSLKCDCGPQLEDALTRIGAAGRGVVVYLRQEGRGIGLADKLRAYALQDEGADTVEANVRLGLPVDARRYDAAAAILHWLGVRSVHLLTNNPDKLAALEASNIPVSRRVPTVIATHDHNVAYLECKRVKMGHRLPALVAHPR